MSTAREENESPQFLTAIYHPTKPLRKVDARQKSFNRSCTVCLAPATGFHYSVATCNGCKTFFRRYVLTKARFGCIRANNKCMKYATKPEGRIRCRSCRFKTCLEQGMDPVSVNAYKNECKDKSPKEDENNDVTRPSSSGSEEWREIHKIVNVETICSAYEIQVLITNLENVESEISRIKRGDIDWSRYNDLLLRILHPSIIGDLSNLSINNENRNESININNNMYPAWLVVDMVSAIHFAVSFNDFQFLTVELKADVILSVVFPLMVAMQTYEVFTKNFTTTNEKSMTDSYMLQYAHFVDLIQPFLQLNIDRKEFLILRSIALFDGLLNVVSHSNHITQKISSTRTFYLRHLCSHILISRGPEQATERLSLLLDTFHTFLNSTSCKQVY